MDALKKYGYYKIFYEKISGISKSRPEYEKVKEILRARDERLHQKVWAIIFMFLKNHFKLANLTQ